VIVVDLTACNDMITQFASTLETPIQPAEGSKLYTGVDLGTAYIVLAVVDASGNPVAGAYQFANVVRDGLVVDIMEAARIVRKLKEELEAKLGVVLDTAATAYPPETGTSDIKSINYVVQAAGFEVVGTVDEPTAANGVLGITDGAVVDIGGGTTGVAIFKDGLPVYVADEPTGGTHFTLVTAGALKISFEEAEEMKKDTARQDELLPLVKPVIQKVASIIRKHVAGYGVEKVYLVGGTSCYKHIAEVIANETGLNIAKPDNPFLVTPLGIAKYAMATGAR
jgi:ethanolamine utilization protein EutJ